MDFDDAGERFDADVGECHDAVVTGAVDPQPRLVLTEHFGDASDGMDMVDLVDRCQGQAAAATTAEAFCVQFHGSNSSSR